MNITGIGDLAHPFGYIFKRHTAVFEHETGQLVVIIDLGVGCANRINRILNLAHDGIFDINTAFGVTQNGQGQTRGYWQLADFAQPPRRVQFLLNLAVNPDRIHRQFTDEMGARKRHQQPSRVPR